jgi:transposase
LHATWAKKGHQPLVPVTGARKSVKIFGCVDILSGGFNYKMDSVFNAETYLKFLEQVARRYHRKKIFYIQDNASYHKDGEVWDWFKDHRKWFEVYNLPPYSPEFNATERLWHHTRITGTHNRYFSSEHELIDTLLCVFKRMQKNPSCILGYLTPFQ